MPLEDTAQTGAEGAGAPIEVTDDISAGRALEGLLDHLGNIPPEGSDDAPPATDSAEADAGTDESPSTGEEEGQSEPQGTAAIESPKSWSDEDKAVFAKLPPDVQKVIAQRESQRDAAFNLKTQEVADQRKAAEAALQSVSNERAQYQQNLQRLLAFTAPEMAEFGKLQDVAWVAQNPADAVVLQARFNQAQARIGAIQQEIGRVQQAQQAELQQRQQLNLQDQRLKLIERVPEFADPQKAQKLSADLTGYLGKYGFSDADISGLTEHRLVDIALKAMRYDADQAARKTAATKAVPQAAPRMQRPGTPQAPQGNKAAQDAWKALNNSHRDSDAARLLESIL